LILRIYNFPLPPLHSYTCIFGLLLRVSFSLFFIYFLSNNGIDTSTTKKNRKQRTIDEKYEIIKYYESIEYKGRGAKEETKKFYLATISSLCTILSQREEVIRLYESNQATFNW